MINKTSHVSNDFTKALSLCMYQSSFPPIYDPNEVRGKSAMTQKWHLLKETAFKFLELYEPEIYEEVIKRLQETTNG